MSPLPFIIKDDCPDGHHHKHSTYQRAFEAEATTIEQRVSGLPQMQDAFAKIVPAHVITQYGALNPVPKPMEDNGKRQVAGIDVRCSQQHARQHKIEERQESKVRIGQVHGRKG